MISNCAYEALVDESLCFWNHMEIGKSILDEVADAYAYALLFRCDLGLPKTFHLHLRFIHPAPHAEENHDTDYRDAHYANEQQSHTKDDT